MNNEAWGVVGVPLTTTSVLLLRCAWDLVSSEDEHGPWVCSVAQRTCRQRGRDSKRNMLFLNGHSYAVLWKDRGDLYFNFLKVSDLYLVYT